MKFSQKENSKILSNAPLTNDTLPLLNWWPYNHNRCLLHFYHCLPNATFTIAAFGFINGSVFNIFQDFNKKRLKCTKIKKTNMAVFCQHWGNWYGPSASKIVMPGVNFQILCLTSLPKINLSASLLLVVSSHDFTFSLS